MDRSRSTPRHHGFTVADMLMPWIRNERGGLDLNHEYFKARRLERMTNNPQQYAATPRQDTKPRED